MWEHCGVLVHALDSWSEGPRFEPGQCVCPMTRHFVRNCISQPRHTGKWVPSRNLFLWMLLALKGCMEATAGEIVPRAHRDTIWMWCELYKNRVIIILINLPYSKINKHRIYSAHVWADVKEYQRRTQVGIEPSYYYYYYRVCFNTKDAFNTFRLVI